VRNRTLGVAALWLLAAASPAQALGISVVLAPTTAVLSNLGPGKTATTTGSVQATVTGTFWTLTVSPASTATPGRLRATSGSCTGSETALVHPLHMDTTPGVGGSIVDNASYDASSATTQIAHGSIADVLTMNFSQLVDSTAVCTRRA
jgi:hypothetical protein